MIKAKLFRLGEWSDTLNKRTLRPEGKTRQFRNRQQMAAENKRLRKPLTRNYQLWVEEGKLSSFNII